jgi:hypothetical protein
VWVEIYRKDEDLARQSGAACHVFPQREREREECLSLCVVVYKCEAKFMKSTLSRYGVGVMLYFGPRMMGFVLF